MEMSSIWQGTFGDIEASVKIINDLHWDITYYQSDGEWKLFSEDQLIAKFDNQSEIESFILGMALALGSLPPEITDQIKKLVG